MIKQPAGLVIFVGKNGAAAAMDLPIPAPRAKGEII